MICGSFFLLGYERKNLLKKHYMKSSETKISFTFSFQITSGNIGWSKTSTALNTVYNVLSNHFFRHSYRNYKTIFPGCRSQQDVRWHDEQPAVYSLAHSRGHQVASRLPRRAWCGHLRHSSSEAAHHQLCRDSC